MTASLNGIVRVLPRECDQIDRTLVNSILNRVGVLAAGIAQSIRARYEMPLAFDESLGRS